jgi:hypothetical protein
VVESFLRAGLMSSSLDVLPRLIHNHKMEMHRLNYFNPYQSKGEWYEDQLTRAFLVVVRMIPLALSGFLDLIREKQISVRSEKPISSFSELLTYDFTPYTQRRTVPQTTGRLISVLMTDEGWKQETHIERSERKPVYDGVLCFDPEWIVIIENKPFDNIRRGQLNPGPESHDIKIDEKAIELSWREVVRNLTALLDASILSGSERRLLEDFLEFLDDQFSYLNPYDTFGLCKNSSTLVEKRCKKILESIGSGQVEWHGGWHTWYFELKDSPAKRCALHPSPRANPKWIELEINPADTMVQAKAFYKYLRAHGTEAFLNLRNLGWIIEPNFHFGYFAKGFGHDVVTSLSLEAYLNYWAAPLQPINQLRPDEQGFQSRLRQFVNEGLIAESDIEDVCLKATKLGAINLNVIPGVEMKYRWPLADAVAIDKSPGMVDESRNKVSEAIATWGGELPRTGEMAV